MNDIELKVNPCIQCGTDEENLSITYGTMYGNQKYGGIIHCNCCGLEVETNYIYSTPEEAVIEAVTKWNKK